MKPFTIENDLEDWQRLLRLAEIGEREDVLDTVNSLVVMDLRLRIAMAERDHKLDLVADATDLRITDETGAPY